MKRLFSTASVVRVAAPLLLLMITPASAGAATPAGPAGTAVVNGLMWATETNGVDIGWRPAKAFCDEMVRGGHDNWRLPTLAELEALYDPRAAANSYIKAPIKLTGCCLWSSQSLVDIPRQDTFYVEGRDQPQEQLWGLLYAEEPVKYYSFQNFPDGQALCVRNLG